MSVQPLFLSYSEPSKEIGTLLWSGIFFCGGGDYDESFKYCRSQYVRKQNNDSHLFSPEKKKHSIQVLDLAILIHGWI